jgi:hypothetical protein
MTFVREEENGKNGHRASGVWRGGRCPSSLDTPAGALARFGLIDRISIVSIDSGVVGPISPNLSTRSGSLWLIGVVFVFVRELFARENLVLSRQELIQRRTLRESDCPLASVGEREEGALVVNSANHDLRFWQ